MSLLELVQNGGTVANSPPSIHNLGLVGHIEDIAVAKDQQGKKLGLRIIQALDYVAEKVGAYKVRDSAYIRYCDAIILIMASFRRSLTAQKRTRASMSSVALSAPAWKWHTTTSPQSLTSKLTASSCTDNSKHLRCVGLHRREHHKQRQMEFGRME